MCMPDTNFTVCFESLEIHRCALAGDVDVGDRGGAGGEDRCRGVEPLYLSQRLSKLNMHCEWGRQGRLC